MGGVVITAKLCLILFFVGFSAFAFAYRTLYRCGGHIEDGLIALRTGIDIGNHGVKASVSRAAEFSEKSGVLVLVSTICFGVASILAFLGLLFS
jgi:hypothetical protein